MQGLFPLHLYSLFNSTHVLVTSHSSLLPEVQMHQFPPLTSRTIFASYVMGTPNEWLTPDRVNFWDTTKIDLYDCNLSH